MVFEGSILGGTRKILGNPYLNSMTVLFDIGMQDSLDAVCMFTSQNILLPKKVNNHVRKLGIFNQSRNIV